jgi:hypothetical protein
MEPHGALFRQLRVTAASRNLRIDNWARFALPSITGRGCVRVSNHDLMPMISQADDRTVMIAGGRRTCRSNSSPLSREGMRATRPDRGREAFADHDMHQT